jgi:hypothetical protein
MIRPLPRHGSNPARHSLTLRPQFFHNDFHRFARIKCYVQRKQLEKDNIPIALLPVEKSYGKILPLVARNIRFMLSSRVDFMKDRVDQVLKLSREILKLEQQERSIRARRDEKRAEMARLLAGENLPPLPPPEYRAGSLTSKIVHLLSTKYPAILTAEMIASTLDTDTPTVRSTLSRLKTAHQVESPNRGEYRAVIHDEEKPATGEGGDQN